MKIVTQCIKLAVFSVLLAVWLQESLAGEAAGQTSFGVWLAPNANEKVVFLPFPTPKDRQVFKHAIIALNIDRVECDGKRLTASGRNQLGCDPDISTLKADSDLWLYRVSLFPLRYIAEHEAPIFPDIEYIDFPDTWSELVIFYRVAFPNGTISEALTIKIRRDASVTLSPDKKKEANQALVPTTTAVTPAADAPVAPAAVAAHL